MIATTYNFDTWIERRGTDCAKHDMFPEDILPMWVADMDFHSPPEIIEAIKNRADHGIFGYTMPAQRLSEILIERMARLYNWQIQPDHIVYTPGVVSAFNVSTRAFSARGDNVLLNTPIYPPMLAAPTNSERIINGAPLTPVVQGSRLRYEIDFDVLEAAIDKNTKAFLFCSPHNPVGRVWTQDELIRLAEICERHNLTIISDDIHADLLFKGQKHIPIASLSPEIEARTVTIFAPSKTYNIPSMGFAFAVIPDEKLRTTFQKVSAGIVPHNSIFGYVAALAAYEHGDKWLHELMLYLEANRDFITDFVETQMPIIKVTHPDGTYLSWLDTREIIEQKEPPNELARWVDGYFLEKAKVALNRGDNFGEPGSGFVRLNFATPRSRLVEALQRIRDVVQGLHR